jgi:hypothetical protein
VFVQRHGLTLPRFDYWRQQLRRDRHGTQPEGFAPVRVVADTVAGASGRVEIVLTSGDRIVIGQAVSGDLLRTVRGAIRPSC